MPVVEVSCPACGAKLKAPDDAAGKKAKCKKCGNAFRIPGGPAPVPGSAGDAQALSLSGDDRTELMTPAAALADATENLPAAPAAKDLAALPSADPFDFGKPALGAAKPGAPAPAAKPAQQAKPAVPPAPAPTKPAFGAAKPAAPAQPPAAKPAPSAPLPLGTLPDGPIPTGIPAAFPGAPAKKTRRDDDEDEQDQKPKSKRRRDEDEEDEEAPRKKKRRDEDDEDEPRAKKKRRDEDDEDEDDRPAKKATSAAEEPYNPFANFDAGTVEPEKAEKKSKRRDDDDDEEEDRPARKKRHDEDDEDDEPKARKKRRRDEDDEGEGEGEDQKKPRYRRPEQQGMGKSLIITAAVGLLALGLAVAAVVVYVKNNREAEQAREEKQDPPASPGVPGDPNNPAPKEKEPKEKEPGEKEPNPKEKEPKEKQPGPKPKEKQPNPGNGRPLITFGKLRTFTVGAVAPKPVQADKPRGGAVLAAPLANVKRVFPPADPKIDDTHVLVQTSAGAGGKGEKLALDTYGPSGNHVAGARIEYDGDGFVTPIADVFASKEDGVFFLAATGGRLHVWNVIDKKKVADGIAPYADKPEHAKSGLAAAFFTPDPNVVALVSTAGGVLLYDLRANKPGDEFIPPHGAPGSVSLGASIAKGEKGASVAVAVAGILYQVGTQPGLQVLRKHDLGGEVGRSLGLAVSDAPGQILYAFESGAEGKRDQIVLGWPKGDDMKPVLYRLPAGVGEPKRALWAGGACGGVETDRGVVWFLDDDETHFAPLVVTQTAGDGQFYGDDKSFWYVVPHPKEAGKSVLVSLGMPFNDFGIFQKDFPSRPLRAVRIDGNGLSK